MPLNLPALRMAPLVRWIGLLALSGFLTWFLELFHLPAALLLGPMAAAIVFAIAGAGLRLPAFPMTIAQGVVGVMIATLLPASLLAEVVAKWPVVLAGTLFTVVVSLLLGWMLARSGLLPGTTAIWGSMPGAASVMTVVSADFGADMRLVAFMQYLRVACVAMAATLVARGFGVTHDGAVTEIIWFPPVEMRVLAMSLGLAVGLAFLGQAIRLPGGMFLAPMIGGLILVQGGWVEVVLPPWVLALSYGMIGWSIGLRFTPEILTHAARVFPRVLGSIIALIAVCGVSAWCLVQFAGIDPLTAYLATSPGGADSVAIISAATKVDVPFVMSMQMSRFLLILFIGPTLARFLSARR